MTMRKKQQKQNKTRILLFSGVALLVIVFAVLTFFQQKQNADSDTSGLTIETAAPDFTLQSTKGKISLADYKGKNVVLYFYEGNG